MPRLHDIPVRVETLTPSARDFGNAVPVLAEIRQALARFAATGEPTQIDLTAIPFGPGDEERLIGLLGRGEVEATVDALGPTRICETRFPGVWLVDYSNADGQRIALQIEVDEVPRLLRTQPEDLADSLTALDARLAAAADAAFPGDGVTEQ